MSRQHYEEGYTITYTTPDGPQHAWRSISLTVWLEILPNVIGNRYGYMQALKKFHDIAVNKKIKRYHITNVQSHSVRNEVSPDWIGEQVVPMKPVVLVNQPHHQDQQELELSQPNESKEGTGHDQEG